MAITAQNLIDMARQRGDFVSSTFLTDSTELLNWCSESYKELWDCLLEAYGDTYGLGIAAVNTVANTLDVTLSVTGGIHKLIRVDRAVDGIRVPMYSFDLADWVIDDTAQAWGTQTVRYYLYADTMLFQPVPNAVEAIRLYYIPRVSLTALSGTILAPTEPWAEYIVVDLAIKMRVKEETDTSDLVMAKESLRRRIFMAAAPRDEARAARTVDVRTLDEDNLDIAEEDFLL